MTEIVLSGNWKSEAMAIRYAQQYQAGKTGMAKVIALVMTYRKDSRFIIV